MTPDQQRRLADVERRLGEVERTASNAHRTASNAHRFLFEKGADGDPPMGQRMAAVVKFAESGEWVVSRGLRIVLVLGALATAWAAFRGELIGIVQAIAHAIRRG